MRYFSEAKYRIVVGGMFALFAILSMSIPLLLPLFGVVVVISAAVAFQEFRYLLGKSGKFEIRNALVFVAISLLALHFLSLIIFPDVRIFPIVYMLSLILPFFSCGNIILRNFSNIICEIFCIVYIVVPFACFLEILFPNLSGGVRWEALYVIFVSKCMDLGGYFIGKNCGKRFVFKAISPKKTLEGFFGGLILSSVCSVLFFLMSPFKIASNFYCAAMLGIFFGCLSFLGDLAESVLKRNCRVKDSGKIPGLGGILDVIDSLTFSVPTFYILYVMKF